ncbi:hypothetical protein TNIN_328421 [Trichonephila inaurata madagascariensis]|uniref:Uncharacterized protein n=1 Tax=Trichonephila inaurata madagascariensis TaxID=2747483 RepID=A0A8X7CIL8_9ARAC|nr:hypothetical protein TNIN_328421 [Trichonephila inaurata madagascariensis]
MGGEEGFPTKEDRLQRTSGITQILLTCCAISGRDLQSVDFIKYPWHRYHLFQLLDQDIQHDKGIRCRSPSIGQMLERNGKQLLPAIEKKKNKIRNEIRDATLAVRTGN